MLEGWNASCRLHTLLDDGSTSRFTMSFLKVMKSSSASSCSYTAVLTSSLNRDASKASTKSWTSTPTSARLVEHKFSTLVHEIDRSERCFCS